MIEPAMPPRITCAICGSWCDGNSVSGSQSAIAGMFSSREDSVAPAAPSSHGNDQRADKEPAAQRIHDRAEQKRYRSVHARWSGQSCHAATEIGRARGLPAGWRTRHVAAPSWFAVAELENAVAPRAALVILLVLLPCASGYAQQPNPGTQTDFGHQAVLTGDWGGLRTELCSRHRHQRQLHRRGIRQYRGRDEARCVVRWGVPAADRCRSGATGWLAGRAFPCLDAAGPGPVAIAGLGRQPARCLRDRDRTAGDAAVRAMAAAETVRRTSVDPRRDRGSGRRSSSQHHGLAVHELDVSLARLGWRWISPAAGRCIRCRRHSCA